MSDITALSGPILFVALDDTPRLVVVNDSGDVLSKSVYDLGIEKDCLEPTDTSQVFVASSFITSKYNFKTCHGRYLTSDSVGRITANKEAVGPAEEWTVLIVDGGYALQSYRGKYVSVDRNTGRVRADSENIGFDETFCIRYQKRDKNIPSKSRNNQKDEQTLEIVQSSITNTNKFVSWKGGKQKMLPLDIKELQDAKKGGRLHEALLEQRMKSKHDPFC